MRYKHHRKTHNLLSRLLKPFLRLSLYITGLKFYTHENTGTAEVIGESVFRTIHDKKMQFTFYRKKYEDILYRRGKTRKIVLHGFMVECVFDDDFPAELKKYNNMKFTLNANFLKYIAETEILHILLEFYVSFIRDDIRFHGLRASTLGDV